MLDIWNILTPWFLQPVQQTLHSSIELHKISFRPAILTRVANIAEIEVAPNDSGHVGNPVNQAFCSIHLISLASYYFKCVYYFNSASFNIFACN